MAYMLQVLLYSKAKQNTLEQAGFTFSFEEKLYLQNKYIVLT